MITGIIIGVILLAGLAFTIYKLETAPTFEQAFPNFHPQCSDCNKGGDACPTCPFRDKDYKPVVDVGPEYEYDEGGNINWSSGQDDVPRPPDGIITFSEGKASRAYIEAKEKDIKTGMIILAATIETLQNTEDITPMHREAILHSMRDVYGCMTRSLL